MINLDKLEQMLDEALARETTESLNKWLEEEQQKDRESGIYNFDFIETLEIKGVSLDCNYIYNDIRYNKLNLDISISEDSDCLINAA
ncbi:MAG: hypothetical protein IJE73_01890 [Muribaculaceae bacterium]|nr:hypothetical protein [Muribaculaceae bacterium]